MRLLAMLCLVTSLYGASEVMADTRTVWDVPFQYFNEFRNRPLFSTSRRPIKEQRSTAVIETTDPTLQEDPNPRIAISGVIIVDAVAKGLLVNEVGSDNSELIKEGNTFLGWTLVRVDSNSATFVNGERYVHVSTPKGTRDRN